MGSVHRLQQRIRSGPASCRGADVTVHTQVGPIDLTRSPHALLRPLEGRIEGGFWAERQRLNRERLLLDGEHRLEEAGNFENLRVAAGRSRTASSAAWCSWTPTSTSGSRRSAGSSAREPSDELAALADDAIELVAGRAGGRRLPELLLPGRPAGPSASRTSPGTTSSTAPGTSSRRRWPTPAARRRRACSTSRAASPTTSARSSARAARRHARAIPRSRWRSSSCTARPASAATSTSPRSSSTRAATRRSSRARFGSTYFQDHVPVREATEVEGHAVRALYLAAA